MPRTIIISCTKIQDFFDTEVFFTSELGLKEERKKNQNFLPIYNYDECEAEAEALTFQKC